MKLQAALTISAVALSAASAALVGCTGLGDHMAGSTTASRSAASAASLQSPGAASMKNGTALFSTDFITAHHPQCLGMVQHFCQSLFSADHQGSLEFDIDQNHYEVRLGETSNDFKQKDYEYLSAKVQGWWRLPSDLREALSSRNLLEKIKAYLAHSSRQNMSLSERIRTMRADEEIDVMWNSAVHETLLIRMEKNFPGYAKIKEDYIPLELKYESQRQLKLLEAEVAKAIWGHHKNWQKVEVRFEHVRQAYREVIPTLPGLSDELKKEWLERINAIKLIIPGSDPEIDADACTKNENNAYFYTEKNELTVCAGDFNTEEIGQTLAHEIAHALDVDRTRFLFQENSVGGRAFHALKDMNCSRKPLDCESWQNQKTHFTENIRELEKFKPQLESFNSCLQDRDVHPTIDEEYLSRIAREQVEAVAGDLAERNVFLRLISPRIPLPDGSSQANPMYLNPCGYYLWDNQTYPVDEDASMLLFFTAEYRCSKAADRDVKFKSAIDTAQELQSELTRAHLKIEGKFSSHERLNLDGFAAPSAEKFADAIGLKVFAHMLKEDDANVHRRRARYLVNNSWLCRRPSLQQLYPTEARIQKSYYVEPHSEHSQRQKDLLSAEMREALDCEPDFESRECRFK